MEFENKRRNGDPLPVAPGAFFWSCTVTHKHRPGTLATLDGTFENLSTATAAMLREFVLKNARTQLAESGLDLPEDIAMIHIIALNRL